MKTMIQSHMNSLNAVVCWVTVILLFGVLAGSAQTGRYLYTGAETNITLAPGTYSITAYGAQGGAFTNSGDLLGGGGGAEMSGEFSFSVPTTLTLTVGGAGENGSLGGGGGGGSFVVNGATPLVVAGGGAGNGGLDSAGDGAIGSSGNNGSDPSFGSGGAGGSAGNGGNVAYARNGGPYGGGGGGGYSGAGGGYYGGGGGSFLSGGAGGSGGGAGGGSGGYGGYGGGGGGGSDGSGGGGGGYSGGGGGGDYGYGGGGGSIVDSSAIADLAEVSGVASPDDSPNGEIIIAQFPNFIEQPSLTAAFTSNATFQVVVQGSPPLTCQWCLNGAPLSDNSHYVGSMETNLTIMDFLPGDIGNYTLVVTNYVGSVTSAVATINILNPIITSQPQSQTVVLGEAGTFSVSATGQQPFNYQWQFDGTNLTDGVQISGSTNSLLTVFNVEHANEGAYQVIVSNEYGAMTSTIASLLIDVPVQIIGQPTNDAVLSGSNASFTVTATGVPLFYQWYFNGAPLTDGAKFSGSSTPTLTVINAQTANDGNYTVQVTNIISSAASSNASLTVYNPAQITSQPVSFGVPLGNNVQFTVGAAGTALGYQWFFNGTPLVDEGQITGSAAPTLNIFNVQNTNYGTYTVLVSNLLSAANSQPAYLAMPSVRYVNVSNSTPSSPYLSWSSAATNIQDAINASIARDRIIVTDGVYQTGGETVNGFALTNRVVINDAITVESVNGPATTVIQGNGAMRCAYLANNAALIGFTLTNGAARISSDQTNDKSGGGVFCESTNCLVINCLVISNWAEISGGGAYSGTLSNCTLANNTALSAGGAALGILINCSLSNNIATYGAGAESCTLNNCTLSHNMGLGLPPYPRNAGYGGGVYGGTLNNCLIVGNSAGFVGGGVYADDGNPITLNNCTINNNTAGLGGGVYNRVAGFSNCILSNCLVAFNSAARYGGGAYDSSLVNCTVTANTAAAGGGIYDSTAQNSILYYNTNGDVYPNSVQYPLNYCCTSVLVPNNSFHDITNTPLFVNLAGGDFHLQPNSPCINSGNNAYVNSAIDLDGNPRIVGGTVDIGAYEYQTPTSIISYAYLQQYGLPTDGSVDFADLDGTAFNVYQDWIAGLNPTNPASVLSMLMPVATNTATGVTVTWQSVSGIPYLLQRSTNLTSQPPFSIIQNNILGQTNTTSYIDTSATNNVPYFYRVGVVAP